MRVVGLVTLLAASALVFYLWEEDEPARREDPSAAPVETGVVMLGADGSKPREEADASAPRELLEELAQASDDEARTRILARHGGERMPFHRGLIEHLVAWLRSDDHALRWQAAGMLDEMDARAGPYVVPVLQDEDADARNAALYVIHTWLGRGQEIPPVDFLALLDDPDTRNAALTLSALLQGVPYEPELAARLLAMVQAQSRAPWMAGWALARMGPRGIELLQPLLSGKEAGRRSMILNALAVAPGEHLRVVLPELVRTLGDPDDGVRLATLGVLQRMGGECVPCLPGLLELIDDESEDGRLALGSLEVLAQMGSAAEAAVPALIGHLQSPNEHMVARAAAALGAIGARPETVLPALQALIEAEASEAAARAMAAYGREGYEYARRLLRGEDPDARHAALLVFAEQGAVAASIVPELIPLLGGEDVWLRQRSIRTVGAIGEAASAAVPALMKELLRGPEITNPQGMGNTLRNLGRRGEQALQKAVRSKQKRDQLQALRALVAFRGRTAFALKEIESHLGAKDEDVRDAARAALLVGLVYPDGFGKTPSGVDDGELRRRVREELTRMVRESDGGTLYEIRIRRSPQQLLDELADRPK